MRLLLVIITCYSLSALSQEEASIRIDSSLQLIETISGGLSPKSVVHSGTGLFLSQHMMYKHKITVHNRNFDLVKTISDKVTPEDYKLAGKEELRGAPVECTFSHDGKFAWVSNYNMTGHGFHKPGCDNCCCSGYDSSFVYKVNMSNYQIENIIAVGSVPKFMAVTPDNSKLVVSNWSSGDISIIDLEKEKEIKRIKVGTHPRGIAISSDSKRAYIAIMGSSRVVELNLSDYSTKRIQGVGKSPRHLCLGPNDDYLYISINGEGKIGKYRLSDSTMTKLRTGRMPRSMEISASGEY